MRNTTMNATDFYAARADKAFARYLDVSAERGENSIEAQTALRQYQSAMIQYSASVQLDNASIEVAA
jgi:hypothetical protein